MSDAGASADLFERQAALGGQALDLGRGQEFGHAHDGMCINALGSIAFLQAASPAGMCKHARMDLDQQEARAILDKMICLTGLSLTQLARQAGVMPSTLTRFVNNPNVKHTLSFRTLKRLAVATGLQITVESPSEQRDQSEDELLESFRSLPKAERDFMLAVCKFRAHQLAAAEGNNADTGTGG